MNQERMTPNDNNTIQFFASRRRFAHLMEALGLMLDDNSPKKIGEARYSNLREIYQLGTLLVLENEYQLNKVSRMEKDLEKEMKRSTRDILAIGT